MERSRNWPDLRSPIWKIRDTRIVSTYTRIILWKSGNIRLRAVTVVRNQTFSGGWVTWPGPVTWPDLTWCWNFHTICGKDVGTGVPKTAALRAAVFLLSPKNLRGCLNTPSGPARVKVHQDRSCYDESNATCLIEIGLAVLEIDGGGGQNLPNRNLT